MINAFIFQIENLANVYKYFAKSIDLQGSKLYFILNGYKLGSINM